MPATLKSISVEGVSIPIATPCHGARGNITPLCTLRLQTDHCSRGKVEQVRCETCGEIVHQSVIR